MTYHLVFDASAVHYPIWRWMAPWLVAAAVGAILLRWPGVYGPKRRRFMRLFGALLIAAGLGGAVWIWRASVGQRERVLAALRGGRYVAVEGVVQHFRPGAADSHPPEEFDVGGRHYRYAPSELLYGFSQVAGAGGPVREGLRVRIADVDGLIARLEIAR